MINATIIRLEQTEEATFGQLIINGRMEAVTLELPWKGNLENVSCIPCGIYECNKRENWLGSSAYGYTFQLFNNNLLKNRTGILIHPANWPNELKGCIAFGRRVDKLRGMRGVLNSGATFHKVMNILGEINKFHLNIIEMFVS